MQAFCPRCGEETAGVGPRGLCADCYLNEHELIEVPDKLAVTVCANCGAVKVGGDWVETENDRELLYAVLDHELGDAGDDVIAVGYDKDEDDNYDVKIMVEQTVDGVTLQQELTTRVQVTKDQCPTCAKFYGGYYTYKIQLRGAVDADVLDVVMEQAAEVTSNDREHFVSDVEEHKHGYDLYISTRTMAEKLMRALEDVYVVEKQRSKELVGQEEGQEVYRSVISARIIGPASR